MIAVVTEAVRAYRRLDTLGKRLFRLEVRLEVKPRAKAKKPRAPKEAAAHTPKRKPRPGTIVPVSSVSEGVAAVAG